MPNRMDQFRREFMGAIGDMNTAIAERKKKRERDAIAAELAQQFQLQGVDSADELEMTLKLQDAMQQRKYRDAMTQRALREPQGRSGGVPRDEDGLTPYQRMQLELSTRREERLSQPRSSAQRSEPEIRGPLMWNGRSWVATPKEVAESDKKAADRRAAIEAEIAALEANVEGKNEYWGPESWQIGTPSSAKLKAKQAELQNLPSAASIYKSKAGGDVEPNADAYAQPVQPQVAPAKVLDKPTALEILKEAGGDKEKARQIAKERGYAIPKL